MPWAGDRIDIVFKRKFPLEEKEGWTDIIVKMAEMIERMHRIEEW
jgi:hypothetical protein